MSGTLNNTGHSVVFTLDGGENPRALFPQAAAKATLPSNHGDLMRGYGDPEEYKGFRRTREITQNDYLPGHPSSEFSVGDSSSLSGSATVQTSDSSNYDIRKLYSQLEKLGDISHRQRRELRAVQSTHRQKPTREDNRKFSSSDPNIEIFDFYTHNQNDNNNSYLRSYNIDSLSQSTSGINYKYKVSNAQVGNQLQNDDSRMFGGLSEIRSSYGKGTVVNITGGPLSYKYQVRLCILL